MGTACFVQVEKGKPIWKINSDKSLYNHRSRSWSCWRPLRQGIVAHCYNICTTLQSTYVESCLLKCTMPDRIYAHSVQNNWERGGLSLLKLSLQCLCHPRVSCPLYEYTLAFCRSPTWKDAAGMVSHNNNPDKLRCSSRGFSDKSSENLDSGATWRLGLLQHFCCWIEGFK